jgi:hypothetical protein
VLLAILRAIFGLPRAIVVSELAIGWLPSPLDADCGAELEASPAALLVSTA